MFSYPSIENIKSLFVYPYSLTNSLVKFSIKVPRFNPVDQHENTIVWVRILEDFSRPSHGISRFNTLDQTSGADVSALDLNYIFIDCLDSPYDQFIVILFLMNYKNIVPRLYPASSEHPFRFALVNYIIFAIFTFSKGQSMS